MEQNYDQFRKDACSKQLILLPSDDVIAEYELDPTQTQSNFEGTQKIDSLLKNNLFVSDCLETYANKKYLVRYKYHNYSGGYRQLPSYQETNKKFLNNIDSLE